MCAWTAEDTSGRRWSAAWLWDLSDEDFSLLFSFYLPSELISGVKLMYCATLCQCVIIKHAVSPRLDLNQGNARYWNTNTLSCALFTFSATYQRCYGTLHPYFCSRHVLSPQQITGMCMYLWKWWMQWIVGSGGLSHWPKTVYWIDSENVKNGLVTWYTLISTLNWMVKINGNLRWHLN